MIRAATGKKGQGWYFYGGYPLSFFGLDYAVPTSISECDHYLTLEYGKSSMREAKHKGQRVDLVILIAIYISPLGIYASWVERQCVIKRWHWIFTLKFLWLLVRYRLCLTVANNLLAWDSATLIACMAVGYDIDFMAIFKYEMHIRTFRKMTTLLFLCLV